MARRRFWIAGSALALAGAWLTMAMHRGGPPPVPAASAAPLPDSPAAACEPPVREAEPSRAAVQPAPLPASPPPAPAASGALRVTLGSHTTEWTKDAVRAVPRAGGTHDLRELVSAFFGETDVSATVAGTTARGDATANVDLASLGPTDQLRLWPEDDGTWTIARNRTSDDGHVTEEAYRLEHVASLALRENR